MNTSASAPVTPALFLERPGGRLAYDVSGHGPLVVASPGLGDLRQNFRFLVADLVAAGYRVATVDLRGHGGSSTGWDDHSETAVAGDLIALVEQLRGPGEPAVLVGNSYSGAAAVVAAAARPDLVAGLVLSGAFVRTVPQRTGQRFATWLVSRTPLGRAVWASYIPSLSPGTRPADFGSHVSRVRANLTEPGRFRAVAAMARAGHDAAAAALPGATAPTLVVMGTKDPDFPDPVAEARFTAAAVGGDAEVVLVEGAGHYPHAQRADLVSPAVVAFLSRVLPPAGQR